MAKLQKKVAEAVKAHDAEEAKAAVKRKEHLSWHLSQAPV